MKLKDKKIAILIEQLYQELEVWYPYYRLIEEGAHVDLIGPQKGKEYPSKFGYPALAEKGIEDVRPDAYDAVIIPGGYAPDHLRRHKQMVHFVKEMSKQNKVIAAICHGGWMLASADILQGKKATCFFAIADDIKHAGATYVDEEVVRDKNIITSRKPEDLPVFCATIIAALM